MIKIPLKSWKEKQKKNLSLKSRFLCAFLMMIFIINKLESQFFVCPYHISTAHFIYYLYFLLVIECDLVSIVSMAPCQPLNKSLILEREKKIIKNYKNKNRKKKREKKIFFNYFLTILLFCILIVFNLDMDTYFRRFFKYCDFMRGVWDTCGMMIKMIGW